MTSVSLAPTLTLTSRLSATSLLSAGCVAAHSKASNRLLLVDQRSRATGAESESKTESRVMDESAKSAALLSILLRPTS
jgi:hypothetical protein